MNEPKPRTDFGKPAAPRAADDAGVPVSEKIRARLRAARERFHANDNIAAFIEPGELPRCSARSSPGSRVLNSLVIDTESTTTTPARPHAGWPRCT